MAQNPPSPFRNARCRVDMVEPHQTFGLAIADVLDNKIIIADTIEVLIEPLPLNVYRISAAVEESVVVARLTQGDDEFRIRWLYRAKLESEAA